MECPHCKKPISRMVLLLSSRRERVCGKCDKPYLVKNDWIIFGLTALVAGVVAIAAELFLWPDAAPTGGPQTFVFMLLVLGVAKVAGARVEKLDG